MHAGDAGTTHRGVGIDRRDAHIATLKEAHGSFDALWEKGERDPELLQAYDMQRVDESAYSCSWVHGPIAAGSVKAILEVRVDARGADEFLINYNGRRGGRRDEWVLASQLQATPGGRALARAARQRADEAAGQTHVGSAVCHVGEDEMEGSEEGEELENDERHAFEAEEECDGRWCEEGGEEEDEEATQRTERAFGLFSDEVEHASVPAAEAWEKAAMNEATGVHISIYLAYQA